MASIIDNIFNSFSSKNEESAIGIDIGSSSVKVVELKKKNEKAILYTYGEIALGPYAELEIGRTTKLPPDKIAEAVVDLMKEANTSTSSSAISIPMKSSMVSIFKMPELKDRQLDQMIPIEARKYIPVPIQEVALDWFVIPKLDQDKDKEDNVVEVMTVAIHNEVLFNYSQIVNGANLDTSFFEVEMFSTIRSVIDSSDNFPIMIVDIGASATKIYISERGIILDSHTFNDGSQKITLDVAQTLNLTVDYAEQLKRNYSHNEKHQDDAITQAIDWNFSPLFLRIKDIAFNFQRQKNKVLSKVILVGGGSLLNNLSELAQEKIQIEVQKGDPFSKVETPAFLADVLKSTGAGFATAIGLALRKLQE